MTAWKRKAESPGLTRVNRDEELQGKRRLSAQRKENSFRSKDLTTRSHFNDENSITPISETGIER
jgi:hypothetical protein